MRDVKRLRRVLILCVHCARNATYYRQGWSGARAKFNGQLLITTNANFIDIAVLEWCKLFGDTKGKHYWAKVVDDSAGFKRRLLAEIGKTEAEFHAFIKHVREYRDRFLAHLDDDERMKIPELNVIIASTSFLYRYLMSNEARGIVIDGDPSLDRNIAAWSQEAKEFYERNGS